MDSARRTVVLRVAPATVVMFAAIFSPVLLMGVSLLADGRQLWSGVALTAFYVGILWWMCGRTVELAPGRLIHRSLFISRVFDVSDLESATVIATPAPRLELRHRGAAAPEPAFVVKPFTRDGVVAILQHIQASSPGARLGRVAKDMNEDKFETITRETVKAAYFLRLVLLMVGVAILAAVARRLAG